MLTWIRFIWNCFTKYLYELVYHIASLYFYAFIILYWEISRCIGSLLAAIIKYIRQHGRRVIPRLLAIIAIIILFPGLHIIIFDWIVDYVDMLAREGYAAEIVEFGDIIIDLLVGFGDVASKLIELATVLIEITLIELIPRIRALYILEIFTPGSFLTLILELSIPDLKDPELGRVANIILDWVNDALRALLELLGYEVSPSVPEDKVEIEGNESTPEDKVETECNDNVSEDIV